MKSTRLEWKCTCLHLSSRSPTAYRCGCWPMLPSRSTLRGSRQKFEYSREQESIPPWRKLIHPPVPLQDQVSCRRFDAAWVVLRCFRPKVTSLQVFPPAFSPLRFRAKQRRCSSSQSEEVAPLLPASGRSDQMSLRSLWRHEQKLMRAPAGL